MYVEVPTRYESTTCVDTRATAALTLPLQYIEANFVALENPTDGTYRTFENNVQGDFCVALFSINSCPIF
jgi:hypothetical protein